MLSDRDFDENDYEALLALDDTVESRKGGTCGCGQDSRACAGLGAAVSDSMLSCGAGESFSSVLSPAGAYCPQALGVCLKHLSSRFKCSSCQSTLSRSCITAALHHACSAVAPAPAVTSLFWKLLASRNGTQTSWQASADSVQQWHMHQLVRAARSGGTLAVQLAKLAGTAVI